MNAPSAPPAYDQLGLQFGINWDQAASENLQGVLERMRVRERFSSRLKSIQGSRIVFILDDSGSMNAPSDDLKTDEYGGTSNQMLTRWEELQQFVRDAIDVYGTLSEGGVDFYFLNRPAVLSVRVFEQIEACFREKPTRNDLTPLSATLQTVLHDTDKTDARKIVINIVTDGSPRSMDGTDSLSTFRQILGRISHRTFVNIRLCTDEDDIVEQYNSIDSGLHRIDVNDDYRSEAKEVKKKKKIDMTRGEYLLKCTIGAADDTKGKDNFDKWDEGSRCVIM